MLHMIRTAHFPNLTGPQDLTDPESLRVLRAAALRRGLPRPDNPEHDNPALCQLLMDARDELVPADHAALQRVMASAATVFPVARLPAPFRPTAAERQQLEVDHGLAPLVPNRRGWHVFLHLARSLLGDPYQEERELWRALELMATSGNAAAAAAASTITGLLVLTIKLRCEGEGFDASAFLPANIAVATSLNDLVEQVKDCPIGGTREEQLAAWQRQSAYAAEAVFSVKDQLKQIGLYSLFERLWTRISRLRCNRGDGIAAAAAGRLMSA